ncbi:MAG: SDR family NAD(P)-dependent oxidoreductase, partial [Muribaculaceae bacterium]|nr:SDR family NAD(P)-dependent oxidoreductase [Muribaculaceae bacterium]
MKRVVIMGASSGIGLAVAEALASRGVKIGLAARHTKELHALKEKYPDCVEYESIDVTHNDGPKKLEELIDKLGGMDIYFHVAGIGYDNPNLDPHREAEMIATNAAGFARMVSAAYGYYRNNNRKGQIVALTSVAGTKGIGEMAAYSASKKCAQTYLVALEQLARKEKVDITFTDIRPGWIRTPLIDKDKKYPMEMTLDYVVPQIIRAIVKHPRIVYIDARWGAVCAAWKTIPDSIWAKMTVSPTKKISIGHDDHAMVEISVENN